MLPFLRSRLVPLDVVDCRDGLCLGAKPPLVFRGVYFGAVVMLAPYRAAVASDLADFALRSHNAPPKMIDGGMFGGTSPKGKRKTPSRLLGRGVHDAGGEQGPPRSVCSKVVGLAMTLWTSTVNPRRPDTPLR